MSRRKNMDKIINLVEQEIAAAFDKAGYDRALAKVTLSNRPDLCEYQCNGAMAGAKKYKKAPFMIAEDVLANLTDKTYIGEIEVVKPGFINIKLNEDAVAAYLNDMKKDDNLGLEQDDVSKKMKKEMKYNIIVAYEKMEDWESAEVKLEEYLESYPNDKAAKKEAEFLETR